MASISFPFTLTAGQPENVNQLNSNLAAISAQVNGNIDNTNLASAESAILGLSQSGAVRRGKSIIATSEARTNTAYGLLTTPDRVSNLVLPTDGLIVIGFKAEWSESVIGAARAALFIGSNQLKVGSSAASPGVQETGARTGNANTFNLLTTYGSGLSTVDSNTAYTGDVTTGQVVGQSTTGQAGPCFVFAAAGTYDITVQYKSSSGTVTAKNRKLWVWTIGF